MVIWGNHSTTQVPDISYCHVSGKAASGMVDEAWAREEFIPTVAKRGGAVIAARGSSSAASAGNAVVDHMATWVMGTADGDWTSMCVPSDGSYGVKEGLIYSFPITCKGGGEWEIVQGLEVSDFIAGKMKESEQELLEEADAVKEMT